MLPVSPLVSDILNKVLSQNTSGTYQLSIELRNQEDPDFIISDAILNIAHFQQDFANSMADDIQASIKVSFQQLLLIAKRTASTYAVLKLDRLTSEGEIDYDIPPQVFVYRVFFHDFEDIAKRINIENLINKDPVDQDAVSPGETFTSIDLRIQLIKETVYKVANSAVQVVPAKAKVGDVIKYLLHKAGIKKIQMTEPDNQVTFSRINIQAQYTPFRKVFDYLQREFGIYSAGLAYYYGNDDIFYMYPKYDTNPDSKEILRIIKVNPASLAGNPANHLIEDGVITVICDSEIQHTPLSGKEVENAGNVRVYSTADRIIDGQVSIGGRNEASLKDIHYAVSNNVNQTILDRAAVVNYMPNTTNQFEVASRIQAANAEIITFTWEFSLLGVIKPGMRVEYVYEDADEARVLTGRVESVGTELLRQGIQGTGYVYTLASVISLRVNTESNLFRVEET